jgi:hypothetical protein
MKVYLASVLVLVLSSVPAAALDDLLGWQSTRWGMTEEQVKAAIQRDGFPVLPPPPRVPYKGAFVATMNVDDARCEVFFEYRAGRLNHVTVSCPGQTDVYARLRDRLAKQYGVATPRGSDQQEWRFPTTVALLDGRLRQRLVTVNYYPAAQYSEEEQK